MRAERKRTVNRNGINIVMIVTAALLASALPAFAGDVAPSTQTTFGSVAEHYLAIQTSLANDSLDQVSRNASAIEEMTNVVSGEDPNQDARTTASTTAVHAAAASLARAETVKEARVAFGKLSDVLTRDKDMIAAGHLKVAYCPMAKEYWLQTGEKIANPYFGSSMLRCGKFVDRVAMDSGNH